MTHRFILILFFFSALVGCGGGSEAKKSGTQNSDEQDAGRYLGISDEFKGRYDHSLDVDSIRSLRPKLEGYDHAQKLKSKPANKDIINDGKPSVTRDQVIYDPKPNAK